jgi:hypothetical protein
VKDRLTYRLPLGLLGNLAHALAAGRQITGSSTTATAACSSCCLSSLPEKPG